MPPTIRFNFPHATGRELEYVTDAIERGRLAGGERYMHRCQELLQQITGAGKVLLTTSCTSALEMATLLAGLGPGDEVILPSFTFTSTANAVVLRGAVPVFVDVQRETLNVDPDAVAAAITPRTRAIVPVHYAGVACDMAPILDLASENDLVVIEDAAQGVLGYLDDRHLGTLGHLGAFSFHQTKNIQAGEGGALLVNDPALVERAEIVWEKGTNRAAFSRGEVDKYTWLDVGGSFQPSELVSAFLLAQLEAAEEITQRRLELWNAYHEALEPLEKAGSLRRPVVPEGRQHNAHIYYLITGSADEQKALLRAFDEANVRAVFHYIPLHSSPAGKKLGRTAGDLTVTEDLAYRLIRLPLWPDLPGVEPVVDVIRNFYG